MVEEKPEPRILGPFTKMIHATRVKLLLGEAGDYEVFVVQYPRHPGALLWHDVTALDDRGNLSGFLRLEDPDSTVAADGGDEPAATAPLGAEQLTATL